MATKKKKGSEKSLWSKGLRFAKERKNRGVVIAVAIIIVGVVGFVVTLLGGSNDEAPESPKPSAPIEVEITRTPEPEATKPAEPDEPTKSAEEKTPAPKESVKPEAPKESKEPAPVKVKEGDWPKQLPLPEGAVPSTVSETAAGKVVAFKLDDAKLAVTFYEEKIIAPGSGYLVTSRKMSPAKDSVRYELYGPGLPENSRLIISDDDTMALTIRKD